ncbi:hypothetical protein [Plantactinospora sp. KBS50]|uniref:hypothetical protein n=1 Tax=Plantactinospora sp. KBS50 TaxID=2024580 RepID=UPI000BAAB8AC|nr:hypothetical protein [Plantactinospora sp. KBS50]ASW55510.1 hypothetical protein CIK06_17010 [Plantactinospora sp. KBS50]
MGLSTTVAPPALALTAHPLQRCGAWAVAVLAGRDEPGELTPDDLDTVAGRLVDDVVTASTKPKKPEPDWWKVLFALYPNAKPTHAKRSRDPDTLRPAVVALFAADQPGPTALPCAFCSAPATVLWAKSHLPMFDTPHAVNNLPPGTAGWPVCRGCRIALWALPYGAWLTAGSATVLMCANPAVERRFVDRNVTRARRIQQVGFTGVPVDAGAEAVALAALRAHAADAPADAVLWSFKNDNKSPWLKVSATRQAIARLLVRIESDRATRRGWRRLRRALAGRNRDRRGHAAIARTLFAGEPGPVDRLLRALQHEFTDPPNDPATTDGWRRLARAYQEEMYGMDVERLAPARRLVAAWIMAERNPRGRFNEYAKVAGKGYDLHRLLMEAGARLLRDGGQPPDISGVAPALLSGGPDSWRWRAQLFFEVVADLVEARAAIGRKPDEPDGDEDEDDATIRFDPNEMEEEYA